MGIVEADQPLTVRPMQRTRVVEAVRFLRSLSDQRHGEPDPVAALRIHHENLAVEVKQHIEGRIARLSHGLWLSH